MSEKFLKAGWPGILEIADKKIPCAVLEDGTRVLTEHGVTTALGSRSGAAKRLKREGQKDGAPLPLFVASQNLNPFISSELRDGLLNPIKYKDKTRIAIGYPAELLPQVCDVWLAAREAGALNSQQIAKCVKIEILMRGMAHVGIIALVDEATGYQEVRDHLAMQAILNKYVTDEWAKWTKTFPDDFYKELFRLKNMPYPPHAMKGKRPSYVGSWTNDIIYSRLGPGVKKALKEKTPRLASGNRPRKFFQHLSRNFGHPELRDLLSNVIFLMKSCRSWDDFNRRLNHARPKYGDTMPLDLDEE